MAFYVNISRFWQSFPIKKLYFQGDFFNSIFVKWDKKEFANTEILRVWNSTILQLVEWTSEIEFVSRKTILKRAGAKPHSIFYFDREYFIFLAFPPSTILQWGIFVVSNVYFGVLVTVTCMSLLIRISCSD